MQELEIQQVGRVKEVFNKYFQCIAIWKRETGIIDENVTRFLIENVSRVRWQEY